MLRTNIKVKIYIPKSNRLGLSIGDNVGKILFAEIEGFGFRKDRNGDVQLNAEGRYFYKDDEADENRVFLNSFSISLPQDDFRAYFLKFTLESEHLDQKGFEMLYLALKNIMVEDSEGLLTDSDIDIIK